METQRITITTEQNYAPNCYIVCIVDDQGNWNPKDERRTVLIDCDFDYPCVASAFGWDGDYDDIDGARDYLDANLGKIIDDLGYVVLFNGVQWTNPKGAKTMTDQEPKRFTPHIGQRVKVVRIIDKDESQSGCVGKIGTMQQRCDLRPEAEWDMWRVEFEDGTQHVFYKQELELIKEPKQ